MNTFHSRWLALVGLFVATPAVISYAASGDKLLDAANPGLGEANNLDPYFLDYNRAQGMAALSNGNVVVAWSERENTSAPIPTPDSPDGANGKKDACFFRIYGPTGTAVSAATRPYLDINADGTGWQNTPMVAALTGGGFVITWNSVAGPGDTYDDTFGNGGDTWARVYSNTGTAVSGTFRVNDNDPNGVIDTQNPRAVVGLSGGGFAIVWEDGNDNTAGLGANANTDDFFLRVFAANGTPAAASARLGGVGHDSFFKDFQSFGVGSNALVALANNTVAVGWGVRDKNNDGTGVSADGTAPNGGGASYFQIFDASGAAVNSATNPYLDINPNGSGSQLTPGLALLSGGGLAVTWNSNHNTDDGGNSDTGIGSNGTSGGDAYVRVYTNAGVAVSSTTRVNDLRTDDEESPVLIKPLTGGGFAIVWQEQDNNTAAPLNNTDDYYVRAFTAAGAASGASIMVGGAASDALFDDIDANGFGMVALTDGGYAVAIRVRDSANNGTGTSLDGTAPAGGYSAAVRVFNADGTSRAGPFFPYGDINPDFSGNQNIPLLCAIAGGGFAVTWHSNQNSNDTDNDLPNIAGSTSNGGDTYTRIFNNSGVALHATVQAHGENTAEPTGTVDQQDPFGIIGLTGGNYAVVIRDDNDNTNNKDDIFLSIFEGVPTGPVATAPTVTTATQTSVTATSATLGGNVTADGGASVTERGIVWKTSTGPTTADNKVQNGSGTGTFSGTVNSLPAGTQVFVRAYAINSVNTSYGNEINFTTLSPTVTLSASPTSIAEAAGVSTITATLSAAVGTSTAVTLTATGTATGSGTDYTLASTTITIPANQLTGTTTVTAVQDSTDEDNETVILDITGVSGGNGATESGSQQVTVTITDDDAVPNLSINDVSLTEGNSGSANLTFTVTLSPASGKTVTVNHATADGTAAAPADYTSASGTLTFTPGQTTRTINVPILGDSSVEANETFFVNLSGATNATISDNQGQGTITNDDVAPDVPMTLTGGSLGIDASSSAGAANTILRFVTGPGGPFLEIFDATRTLGAPAGGTQVNANTVRIPIASLTGGITLTGSALADTFTLDFSSGDICPPGGISVVGGAPTTSPGDTLAIDGDFTSGGSYGTGSPGAGTLTLDSGNTVNFTGLEPVDLSAASFTDFTVTVDPGNAFVGNVITTVAAVDAGVNTNISFGASGLESTKLGVVTGTLTINGDNVEQDYFVLQGLGSAMAGHFVVDGRGGDSDVIEVNNTTFTVAGLNKNVSLKADFIGLGRINAVSPADNPGVIVCSGNITLEADGDSSIATSTLWGVTNVWGTSVPAYFNASQVPHTARGTIQVLGDIKKTAGADATLTLKAKNAIVMPNSAATATSPAGSIISTSNKLHVLMNADSDAVNAGNVVMLERSVLTTNGGDWTVGGGATPLTTPVTGIPLATNTAPGVFLRSSTVTTSGGNVSIRGQGAIGAGGHGLVMSTSASTVNCVINSGAGTLTVNAVGGSNTGAHGIFLVGSTTGPLTSRILSGAGSIDLNGTGTGPGGSASFGINLGTMSEVNSTSAAVSLTAEAPANVMAIILNPGASSTATVAAGTTVTLTADAMNLALGTGTESVNAGAGAGTIVIKPKTLTGVLAGAADAPGTSLGIDPFEFNTLTADTVTLGSPGNTISVTSSVISPLNFKTLALAGNTTFTSTGGFSAEVTSSSVYEKITVAGTVTISAGATLATASAGGYIWNGTDAFTFLDNDASDAISGTFTGPTLTNFLGSTSTATQSYTGGTGNDLVISAPPSANADLATLTTTAGALSPVFAAGTTSYSTPAVLNATSSATVTATRAQANATLQVRVNGGSFTSLTSGSASGALALNVGANTIDVKVTAQDGTTTKTYTINVTRNPPPAAPTLTSVSPSGGAVGGGAVVVIVGRDFTGATAVKFGTTAATSFTINSDTQITATVPAGSAGILDVSVTTGLGTGTGSGLFYYYATTGSTPAMAASKIDLFTPNGAGKVLPGAPIQYRTLIANTGNGNATTVDFADAIPANTTLVAGSVNVSPLAEDDSYATIVNTQLAAGSPTVLSGPLVTAAAKTTDNDREFLADTFTISAFDATSANGGSVVMVTSGANMGSFTYVPAAGFVGVDSFTYTLRDDGTDSTSGNADDLTGIGTVVITVNDANTGLAGTQKVWYLDNSYTGANGTSNGTSARPFTTLSAVSGGSRPDEDGDTLFVAFNTPYTGGITLRVNQTLWGEGTALVLNGITLAAVNDNPVITNAGGAGITLATNNTITGMAVANTSTFDIEGGAVGNLTIANTICNGTGGIISITSGALNVAIAEASTTSAATGISLADCTGTFTAGSVGSISGVSGTEINLSGGSVNFTYSGGVTSATGSSIVIANRTGGTATLAGLVNITGGTGVSLTSNTGSTINFTGGLTASTGANTAFTATGGGTVNVTGATNTLTTTTATALNVANTTIGASGLNFRSISSGAGASNGITLDTTGSSGSLTVTGSGAAGSGGTISGKTGADGNRSSGIGIYLNNTLNPSFTRMQLNDCQNFAIRGNNVNGFTLANCVINGANGSNVANITGDSYGEGSVYFGNNGGASADTDGGAGTFSITNCTISGGRTRNLSVVDSGATGGDLRLNVTNGTFGLTQAVVGSQSLALETRTSGTTSHSTVQGCTFAGQAGDNINFTGQTGTTQHIIVGGAGGGQGNTLSNTHPNNNIGGGSLNLSTSGIQYFDVRNNIMSGANGSAVTIFKATSGTVQEGVFDSNTIGTSGVASSGSATGNGIFFSDAGAGTVTVSITNNMIQRYANAGIFADNTGGTYAVNLTITGNTVRQPESSAFGGLGLTNGSPGGPETTNVFARIMNNDFSSADPFNVNDVLLGVSGSAAGTHTFTLSGATAGDVASFAAIQTFIQNNNNLNGASAATTVLAYNDAPATLSQFKASAALPPTPTAPTPLLFAENLPEMAPQAGLAVQTPVVEKTATVAVSAPKAQNIVVTPETLTQASLEKLAAEAVARWEAAGLTETQKQRLKGLRFEISDLSTLHLGQASGDLIQISRTAAGNSWFIDETPRDDSEFESGIEGVDLLTTLMHEMGHALGLTDRYDLRSRGSIMYGHLTRGERRLPAKGEAAGATTFTDDTQRYLGATINIGTLPAGKSVTIVGTVLVNDPANTQLISSRGTVSGGNFTTFVTDDPAVGGTTDFTETPVERPDATVVSLTRQSANPNRNPSVTWQVVFDQAVDNLTASHFSVVNGGLGGTPAITGISETSGPPSTTWNITASTGTGTGTLGLNMVNDSGALSHDITNLAFTGQVYTIDRTPPVFVLMARQSPSVQNTNLDTLTFQASFSETVVGLDATDFTISGTTATISGITGTGPYDITLSGGDLANLNGTVSLALAAGQNIADTAGNPLPTVPPVTNQTYIVDNTAPTVTIASATLNPAPNAVIPVTVTFTESVTGFDLTDITVTGGTKSNFAGTGANYTFDLTPSGPGVTVTADIAANAAQDTALNNNTAATQFSRNIVDAVSIAATTATAAEGGATGLYTFTRGASTGDLTVSFQLDASSTATAGTDFNLTSGDTLTFNTGTGAGTIVIPNGQLTATVTLTALTESPNPAEAAETARLNVVAGSGYVAGSPANATVTITENSFLVTTTNDSGTGSLRQAVLNANSIAGTDTITFSDGTGGTVNFTDNTPETITVNVGGTLLLSSSLIVEGPGADRLSISGSNATGVFSVGTGSLDVTLSKLSIINGSAPNRGGIASASSGVLRVTQCALSGNTTAVGAAILNNGTGSVLVAQSTISGNTASNSGGAIYNSSTGSVTVVQCTLSGNTASSGNGGAINNASTGSITVLQSTVTSNTASGVAGGVRNVGAGVVTIANTIIAGNIGGPVPDVDGAFTSNGGNLIGKPGTATGFTNGTNSDQVGNAASPINPLLGALANNGGPTRTHALLAGSPALNAGLNAQIPADTFDINGNTNTTEAIPFDQRGTGFTRAIGTVDIGAFELQKSVSIGNLAAISEGNSGTTNFVFTITRTGDTTGDVNMTYTVSGAAVNGTDFVGGTLPTGTATITNGNATTTVTIPVSGDTAAELNESFTVTLSAPDNGYVVSGAPATSTINNDDTLAVTINQASGQADPSNALALSFTAVFSEAVTGFTTGDVTLGGAALPTTGTVTEIAPNNGTTFNVAVSGMSAQGAVTATIGTNVALSAGGAGNAASTSTDNSIIYDSIAPTVGIVVADTALRIGETSLVTFTFSEAVTGFTNADLTLANGTLSSVSSGDGGITWTATFTPTAGITDATNVITVDKTGVADIAGNAGVGSTNSNNYAIDTLRPTVGIVVADTALRIGGTSLVTFTFSEAVTGFTNADLTIANGSLTAVSSGDGGVTWTATLTPTAGITDSTNVITIDLTGVADLAGNAGSGTTDSNNYAIDTVRPTVGIVVADNALRIGETSLVTFTFSEAVTGFTNADLTIANGTLSAVSSADGGTTWTATLTPAAGVTDSTNLITIDLTGVADLAGNAGSGTTDSNNYAVDTQRPTVGIVVADTAQRIGETSLVTFTFSEAVSGFTNADLTLQNGTLSAVSSSDGGTTWTATFTPTAGITDSTNVITIDLTGVVDAAGNAGSGTTDSNNYAIDTVRPTVGIVVADNALRIGETSLVTFTFSEAVTGFTNADLTIANGSLTAVSSGDGGVTWTATLTPTAGITDSTNLITIDLTGVADLAGNAGSGTTDSNNYAIDTQRPTVGIVVADTTLTIGETSLVTITFSETVSGLTIADFTVQNGTLSSPSSGDGGLTWTATLTPAVVVDATNVITLDNTGVTDAAGNTGSGTTDSNNYAIDINTITIAATDAAADENSAGTGTWRVTRNGSTGAMTVNLAIDASSTAAAVDWSQSGATFASLAPGSTGTVIIPNGSTFADITLTPSADLHAEAAETVRLNVTASAAYVVGAPADATVTIGQNDFLVINTNNAGEGTLRQAVLNANALVGTDTITFSDGTGGTVNFTDATADTITLSGGEITLASDLTIAGPGANLLLVQNTAAASTTSRVFNITSGLMRLRGLTITGGNATTDGGGIQIAAPTNVTLIGCAIAGNSTTALGGGISSAAFSLSIVSSTISGNSAAGVNTAGGIHSTGVTFNLLNSTVSGNSSTAATGSNAGGILGNGTMTNCTVTNNSVANPDPSIVGGVGGGFTVSNSLIAGNVANTTRPDVGGSFTSNGGNVIGNVGTATGFTATNDLKGTGAAPVSPLIGALADNGGPTLTHILLNGSPAINNGLVANLPLDTFDLDGDTNVAEVLPVDQRGDPNVRQRGPAPDAGAVEAFAFEPTISASPAVNEDTQTTSGLVITANTADGGLTTHYQITGITAGTLYQNDGTTVIAENDFITKAQGTAGLKFTPSLNLNNTTTPLFGFTVQAAVGNAAGDQRGATVSTTISVNPVNDAPTVVAPGIADQTVTVGTPVVVPLPANFTDVDLDALTYSVTGNTDPTKATATLTGGTNVTLNALAYGETDVTIQASDGNGGTVTDTFRVFARTVDPTATMPATPAGGWSFSPVNAMFNITVPVQNTTALPVNGMRLTVNVAAYLGAQPSLRLWNATRTTGPGIFEIDYPYPVAPQATVSFSLIFYTSTRLLPNPFVPVLTVAAMPASAVPGPLPAGLTFVPSEIRLSVVGRIVLEWSSTAGKWYRIYYNDGLDPNQWLPCTTPIQAGSNRQQWSDEGAPFTAAPPGAARFYRVTEIPAP